MLNTNAVSAVMSIQLKQNQEIYLVVTEPHIKDIPNIGEGPLGAPRSYLV